METNLELNLAQVQMDAYIADEAASKARMQEESALWSAFNCKTTFKASDGKVVVRLSGIPKLDLDAETPDGSPRPFMYVELELPSLAYARLRSFFSNDKEV